MPKKALIKGVFAVCLPESHRSPVGRCRWARSLGVSEGAAPLLCVPLIPTAQNHQKRPPKSSVQKGVQERVQPRVNVAEPEPSCPQLPGNWVVDEGVHHVSYEKRSPAQAETAHNNCQRLRCLCLYAHAAVCNRSRLRGRGACSWSNTVVIQWIWGSGSPHSDDWICAGGGSRAGALQSLNLSDMCHGGDIDALICQDHEDQRNVEGHSWAD